jgi:methylenetetrahydrofolate dehydrogenase (NADP+)/methenyltetrahydrofolate cyclohydrolase
VSLIIDPSQVAKSFRDQIRAEVASLPRPPRLVGILAQADPGGPSATYAEYTRKACEDVGAVFDLRRVRRLQAEGAIRAANRDADTDGVFVYYPVFGTGQDSYLRDLVEPGKDVEGLHEQWARMLYENRRYLDTAQRHKAILPCTPLAILKLLEAAGITGAGAEGGGHGDGTAERPFRPLAGRRACVFNRSEVIGRPLAAMMANDGAEVVSFDIDGPLLFAPDPPADEPCDPERGGGAHRVQETTLDRREALAGADIVITGVPSPAFEKVHAHEIPGSAVCINFSTLKNFDDDVAEKAAVFVPRVGPMTVTMALRNTLRLVANRQPSTSR